MIEALQKAKELWNDPDELIAYWANSPEKIAQERLVKRFMAGPGVCPKILADVGCGVGRYAAILDYDQYHGYDGSTAMVLRGTSKYAENRRVDIVAADIFNFQPDITYDALIMIDVAHHQNDPVDALCRIMDLWKSKLYYFSVLVGDAREDLHSATIVNFVDLLRFYDLYHVTRTHIQRFDDNPWAWVLLEAKL